MIIQQKRYWNLDMYLKTLFIFTWSVYPLISSTKSGTTAKVRSPLAWLGESGPTNLLGGPNGWAVVIIQCLQVAIVAICRARQCRWMLIPDLRLVLSVDCSCSRGLRWSRTLRRRSCLRRSVEAAAKGVEVGSQMLWTFSWVQCPFFPACKLVSCSNCKNQVCI